MLQSNIVASGGLGCEVFIWDLEAAMVPVARASSEAGSEGRYDGFPSGLSVPAERLSTANSTGNASGAMLANSYAPIPAKGHKESVYALAMNDSGTLLVSGGTEKVSFQTENTATVFSLVFLVISGCHCKVCCRGF
jgi:WD repeat-containing protein 48